MLSHVIANVITSYIPVWVGVDSWASPSLAWLNVADMSPAPEDNTPIINDRQKT